MYVRVKINVTYALTNNVEIESVWSISPSVSRQTTT